MGVTRIVRVGGREFRVRIVREGDVLVAELLAEGGEPHRIRLEPAGEGRALLNREPLEYELERRGRTAFALRTGAEEWPVEILSEGEAALETSAPRVEGASSTLPVRAPMPGRLLAVEVSEGQTVAEGQGLFIVEAMKMENEIRASHAGRVVGVAVAEGEPVEQEQVLCHLVVGGAGASGRAPGGAS